MHRDGVAFSVAMRVGYFGGSFDPPHRGHLAVARAAQQEFSLDRVLLAPTGSQPLKPDGAVAGYADRLAMVELMCAERAGFGVGKLEASRLDAPRVDAAGNPLPNYTIDALAALRRELDASGEVEAESFVLVGVDAFLDLRRWRSPEALLAAAEWIVLARPGFAMSQLDSLQLSAEQRARVHVVDWLSDEANATEIRRRLSEGPREIEDCGDLLLPSVLSYIRAHHLYGA